jgi:hypothetical protein
MTDPLEQWNAAMKAGLVGSREGNRKRMGASPPEGTPKARKMLELGFPSNFWLPLKAVEAWRTDDYPAQPTIESIRIWLVLKDEQLRFDFREGATAYCQST